MTELAIQIEALLFALGKPLSRDELMKKLDVVSSELEAALQELSQNPRGVALIDDGKEVELRVAPAASELIEHLRKEEYDRELGRAGQETLAAILYRGPLSRAEIDFIRGVNSTQILRTLTIRGLVRRVPNPRDERSILYEPTTELLSHLGVVHVSDLPEYAEVRSRLDSLEHAYRSAQTENT